jgi:hypothetical protein
MAKGTAGAEETVANMSKVRRRRNKQITNEGIFLIFALSSIILLLLQWISTFLNS